MNQAEAREVLALLEDLRAYGEVDKITSTFIPAFKNKSIDTGEGTYLHGSFRLGGTVSGRLSSAGPNLQQIPSTGTKYAKPIKKCFQPPRGWVFVGCDYSSLEDRISALTTRDPNKLKPYLEGYDGHSLRAFAYFRDRMDGIDGGSVESVNSIAEKYPELRQDSKMPTFSLTYGGTYRTLVQNGGFTEEEAKQIEAEYHELYKMADQWVEDRLQEAGRQGYVRLAFDLRLRTPILQQVVMQSHSGLPYEAYQEKKTAGNALGQSWGLLNTRAANRFMKRVWASEYRADILPVAQIHDAIYLQIRNQLGILKFVNDNLIDCMVSDIPPEIQHPEVGLEAQLEIYYPDWSQGYAIPNGLSLGELKDHLSALVHK